MSRFQISEEEYKAIKQAEKETNAKNVSRRLRVLMLRHDGYKAREVAKMVGMRLNSISQLCRRYREQGLEEFKRNKYTSHRQALPVEQEEEILARFEKAAEAGQEVTALETGTWPDWPGKPATGRTWGSRGAGIRDAPSKCRAVRKLDGISRLSLKMRGSSSSQTETCRLGTVHPFAARHLDRWDRDDGCYRTQQCGNHID